MNEHVERVTAFLDGWAKYNQDYPVIDHGFGAEYGGELTKDDLRALVADAKQLRTLRPEFGIRADWISTRSSEGPVAETLGDALEALDEFDARHGGRLVKRTLIQRPVGEWEEVGSDG